LQKRNPHSSRKTIFLTGASGLLGRALLEKLSDYNLICLTHRTLLSTPNIISLKGDVTQRWFGLNQDEFNHLAQCIDYIVHIAAITDFLSRKETTFRTNIDGTRNILELAETAQASLFHISTAFVHPSNQVIDGDASYAYVHSKREGERAIRESGLPHTILRPSIIIGDSQTGAIAKFQGFHLVTGLITIGGLPVLPISPHYYVDFVPQDVVVDTIAACIDRNSIGSEWWLTAGEQALTVRAVVDSCVEHSHRLTGHSAIPPKVVDSDLFERLILPVFLPALPRHQQKTILRALHITKVCTAQPLPSSWPDLERQFNLSALPNTELTLVRNLEYWAATQGYGSKQVALEPTKVSSRGGID